MTKTFFLGHGVKRRDDKPHSMSLRSGEGVGRLVSSYLCQQDYVKKVVFILSFWSDRSGCRDWKHVTCIEHLINK